ncbi:MAG TPA: hypothetical protein PKJ24_06130 [Prolixibacteraceae bacterium]|nr:hypothetical protein [Prolixibacteraceae bacterium]HPT31324.1 hypothetical protein [Prolixibacteraceae bacterium]
MNSITIIGIIITALIIVPIWYLIHTQGAGKRKLEKEISALGKGMNISISEHESFKNKVIGIDREGFKGALAVLTPGDHKLYIADLKQFNRCSVNKELLNSGSKYDNDVVNKITLRFTPKNKGTEEVTFPVYSEAEDKDLANELMVAQNWAEKFNLVIQKF